MGNCSYINGNDIVLQEAHGPQHSSELNNHNSDNQLYAFTCTPSKQFSTEDLYYKDIIKFSLNFTITSKIYTT